MSVTRLLLVYRVSQKTTWKIISLKKCSENPYSDVMYDFVHDMEEGWKDVKVFGRDHVGPTKMWDFIRSRQLLSILWYLGRRLRYNMFHAPTRPK